jgi:hypothetical protein
MLTDDIDYHDLGGDYFARLDPERTIRRIIRQANALGFTVRFDPSRPPEPQPGTTTESSCEPQLTIIFGPDIANWEKTRPQTTTNVRLICLETR